MINVGIFGDERIFDIAELLAAFYRRRGLVPLIVNGCNDDSAANAELCIYPIPSHTERALYPEVTELQMLVVNNADDSCLRVLCGRYKPEYIVINSDESGDIKTYAKNPDKVITYGLNTKAYITASSIMDGSLQVCIQHSIGTAAGNSVEQQEFALPLSNHNGDVYSVMGAVSAALVSDVDVNGITLQ